MREYAYPLYFGRWLMVIGVAIFIENYPLTIAASIILAAILSFFGLIGGVALIAYA